MSGMGGGYFPPQMQPLPPPEGSHPHPSGSKSNGSWITPEPTAHRPVYTRAWFFLVVALVIVLVALLLI